MVERERDEGEAMVVYGPRHEGGGGDEAVEAEAVVVAAAGEKGEGERDDDTERGGEEERKEEDEEVEKEKKDEVVLEEWSEIRLAIAELSPISHGKLSSSPPTLPFLSISLLILQVLGEYEKSSEISICFPSLTR
jgi:TATA-binding protein-associated factor Taf7